MYSVFNRCTVDTRIDTSCFHSVRVPEKRLVTRTTALELLKTQKLFFFSFFLLPCFSPFSLIFFFIFSFCFFFFFLFFYFFPSSLFFLFFPSSLLFFLPFFCYFFIFPFFHFYFFFPSFPLPPSSFLPLSSLLLASFQKQVRTASRTPTKKIDLDQECE